MKSKGFHDISLGKVSACNTGDPGLVPGSGRSAGEEIGYPLQYFWASLVAQLVELPAGDLGSVPGLGRYPGEGKCYPLQYSGLENTMYCMYSPWGPMKSKEATVLKISNFNKWWKHHFFVLFCLNKEGYCRINLHKQCFIWSQDPWSTIRMGELYWMLI